MLCSHTQVLLVMFQGGLLWLVVVVLWIIRFKHSYMFSTFSTFMLVFLTMLLVVPHYIFSLDVQFHVNMDTRTLRNLGVNRVVVVDQATIDAAASSQSSGGGRSVTAAGAVPDAGTTPSGAGASTDGLEIAAVNNDALVESGNCSTAGSSIDNTNSASSSSECGNIINDGVRFSIQNATADSSNFTVEHGTSSLYNDLPNVSMGGTHVTDDSPILCGNVSTQSVPSVPSAGCTIDGTEASAEHDDKGSTAADNDDNSGVRRRVLS